jgi:FtsP/CotA-like multicopper oxidase with cupredoxin domain
MLGASVTTETEAAPGEKTVDRRLFMGLVAGGVGGAALVGGTALAAWPTDPASSAAAAGAGGTHHDTGTQAGSGSSSGGTVSADEMDAMHEEGITQFLANIEEPITEGLGCVDAEFTMDGDTKVFELTCSEVDWEVTPGQVEKAMAYNGIVPGPTIRVVEGDRIRIVVTNELQESTAVHWHGMRLPNDQDGVPFITQPPIKPGDSYTYEFVAQPFGSHMYHSHHNAAVQVGSGLLGALIVEPKDPSSEPEYDKDYLYIFNDALGGFTINGKGFPATSAYTAKVGERVRFRFMNEGNMVHPVHLHGFHLDVFARDGYPLPQPFRCDTLTVAPGERWDAIVTVDELGVGAWAFHCHILTHAESEHGMFGMVSAFIVEEDA